MLYRAVFLDDRRPAGHPRYSRAGLLRPAVIGAMFRDESDQPGSTVIPQRWPELRKPRKNSRGFRGARLTRGPPYSNLPIGPKRVCCMCININMYIDSPFPGLIAYNWIHLAPITDHPLFQAFNIMRGSFGEQMARKDLELIPETTNHRNTTHSSVAEIRTQHPLKLPREYTESKELNYLRVDRYKSKTPNFLVQLL